MIVAWRGQLGHTAKQGRAQCSGWRPMADKILTGQGSPGTLYACVCETAHHVEPRVDDWRLGAVLHPFRSESEARAALVAAGATDIGVWSK